MSASAGKVAWCPFQRIPQVPQQFAKIFSACRAQLRDFSVWHGCEPAGVVRSVS